MNRYFITILLLAYNFSHAMETGSPLNNALNTLEEILEEGTVTQQNKPTRPPRKSKKYSLSCPKCGKSISGNRGHLNHHIATQHDICAWCTPLSDPITNLQDLIAHLQTHSSTKKVITTLSSKCSLTQKSKLTCPECGKSISGSIFNLNHHRATQHDICAWCNPPSTPITDPQHFIDHLQAHSGTKNIVTAIASKYNLTQESKQICPECSISLSGSITDLRRHRAMCHNICAWCNPPSDPITNPQYFIKHLKTHKNTKSTIAKIAKNLTSQIDQSRIAEHEEKASQSLANQVLTDIDQYIDDQEYEQLIEDFNYDRSMELPFDPSDV